MPTRFDGVDVLPADAGPADATVVLAAEVGRERRLREALAGVGEGYDYVLVDTTPTRSLLTTNVLNAVQELIVPFTPGLFGVLGPRAVPGGRGQVRRFLENEARRRREGGRTTALPLGGRPLPAPDAGVPAGPEDQRGGAGGPRPGVAAHTT